MIDLFLVFHRGGAILYKKELNAVPGNPLNALIENVLIEERTAATSYRHEDKYTVKWVFANELDLVFVAVYLNLTNLLYMDELLVACKDKFCSLFRENILAVDPPAAFSKKFNRIFDDLLTHYESGGATTSAAATAVSSPTPVEKKPQHSLSKKKAPKEETPDATDDEPAAASPAKSAASESAASPDASDAPSVNASKLAALQQAARTGKGPVHAFGKKKKDGAAPAAAAEVEASPAKKGKTARTWDNGKASKSEAKALDYTRVIDGESAGQAESTTSGFDGSHAVQGEKYGKKDKLEYSDDEDEGDDDTTDVEEDDSSASSSAEAPKKSGGFFSYFKTLVAGKVLERSDLEPILQQFKDMLNSKNVAAEISEQLAESVIKTLEGQKLASFTSIKTMVRQAIEAALTRILTPNRQIDVLAGVVEANEEKRPYSIVFVGVNGVGKCWGLGTKLMMFDGSSKAVELIEEGDQLMGDDGTPRTVLSGSITRGNTDSDARQCGASAEHSTYRIRNLTEGRDNDSWTCNGNHILVLRFEQQPSEVQQSNGAFYYSQLEAAGELVALKRHSFATEAPAVAAREEAVRSWTPLEWEGSVAQFLQCSKQVQAAARMFQPESVQFQSPKQSLKSRLDSADESMTQETAWILGKWLSEAAETNTIQLRDASSVARVQRWHQSFTGSSAIVNDLTVCTVTLPDAFEQLAQSYDLQSSSKRIPNELLGESSEIRSALFRGLTADIEKAKVQTFSSDNAVLLEGVRHLSASLGFASALKKNTLQINQTASLSNAFDVTRVAHADYYGFSLDGNGRCLMADFTVSHNSTSLAKTAHYFLSKDLTVGVIAGDTFRAGAIEQLRTHTKALNIPLYARGYDRDAAAVAQEGINQARKDGLNVVLVDTAGRMQHNEPLMRSLTKLITINKPDLVLFVGEALVGNDAVDQVREFNRALTDLSEEKKPRLIDGIILTKFDTIDDKVGAAISMAYVTGQPILFVGTGQTYQDLKRMNVKILIRALMR